MLQKRFIEICPLFMTWKSTNFLYPPSQQERERDNLHKILKMGSLHWIIIYCNEIQKLRLVTELYTQKWSDDFFAQWVYTHQETAHPGWWLSKSAHTTCGMTAGQHTCYECAPCHCCPLVLTFYAHQKPWCTQYGKQVRAMPHIVFTGPVLNFYVYNLFGVIWCWFE